MAGKVDTPDMRFTNNARYFQDGSSMTIAFEGRQYRFEVRQKALDLSLGSTSQRISDDVGAVDQDDSLALVWAGDLDGDGQLDFLLAGTGKNSDACACTCRARPRPARWSAPRAAAPAPAAEPLRGARPARRAASRAGCPVWRHVFRGRVRALRGTFEANPIASTAESDSHSLT